MPDTRFAPPACAERGCVTPIAAKDSESAEYPAGPPPDPGVEPVILSASDGSQPRRGSPTITTRS
jgi:hypothetical protein